MNPPTAPHCAPSGSAHTWLPWLLVMILFSLVVALAAGILSSAGGAGLAEAVMSGGTAFGATMVLCLGAVGVVRDLRRPR